MYDLDHLKESLDRHDAFSFLFVYLQLVQQGASLSLPKDSDSKIVQAEWLNCMPSSCQHVTDLFLKQLTTLWLNLVLAHSGPMSDYYVSELLDLLKQDFQSNKSKNQLKSNALKENDPNLMNTKLSISSDYKLEEKVLSQKFLGKDELYKKCVEYYLQSNSLSFLNYFLQWCLIANQIDYPKVSVLEHIEQAWGPILFKVFNKKPNQQFLKDLSHLWFQLVNHSFVPYTKKDLKQLIFNFQKKYFKDIQL